MNEADGANEQGIEIPPGELAPETLQAVIESFIMREGTDYGELEWSLAEKVAQVKEQLARREIALYFDLVTQSMTLVPRDRL